MVLKRAKENRRGGWYGGGAALVVRKIGAEADIM